MAKVVGIVAVGEEEKAPLSSSVSLHNSSSSFNRPGGGVVIWTLHHSVQGRPYYFNHIAQVSTWEPPRARLEAPRRRRVVGGGKRSTTVRPRGPSSSSSSSSSSLLAVAAATRCSDDRRAGRSGAEEGGFGGWARRRRRKKEEGCCYDWVNISTGECVSAPPDSWTKGLRERIATLQRELSLGDGGGGGGGDTPDNKREEKREAAATPERRHESSSHRHNREQGQHNNTPSRGVGDQTAASSLLVDVAHAHRLFFKLSSPTTLRQAYFPRCLHKFFGMKNDIRAAIILVFSTVLAVTLWKFPSLRDREPALVPVCTFACFVAEGAFLWILGRANLAATRLLLRSFTFVYLLFYSLAETIVLVLHLQTTEPIGTADNPWYYQMAAALHNFQLHVCVFLTDALDFPSWTKKIYLPLFGAIGCFQLVESNFLQTGDGTCFDYGHDRRVCTGPTYVSIKLTVLLFVLKVIANIWRAPQRTVLLATRMRLAVVDDAEVGGEEAEEGSAHHRLVSTMKGSGARSLSV